MRKQNLKKTGIVLINIGSPKNTSLKDVRNYLRRFLSDPKVITLPWIFRKILVNCFIVPFRAKKTQHAYKKIWGEEGSPLIANSKKLQIKLQNLLDENNNDEELNGENLANDKFIVKLGMSYSEPFLQDAIKELVEIEKCNKIIILPLYPQYAEATNGSAIEDGLKFVEQQGCLQNKNIKVKVVEYFYNNQDYLSALSAIIKERLNRINNFDFVLFGKRGTGYFFFYFLSRCD